MREVFAGARKGPAVGQDLLAAVAACVGLAVALVAGARLDLLAPSAGVAAVLLLALVGLRRPMLPLFLFAALIPIEDLGLVPGLGTLSRLVGIVFAVDYAFHRRGRLRPGALPLWAWLYVGWAMLSVCWAISPGTALGELATLLQMFVMALLVANAIIERPSVVRPLLWAYSLSASAMAAVGLYVYLSQPLVSGVRAAALPGQDPAQFAAMLLPALILGLDELAADSAGPGRPAVRTVAGGLAALNGAAVILSGTRGVWVAALVGAAMIILSVRRSGPRIAVAAGLLALCVAVLQLPGAVDLVAGRAALAIPTGGAGRLDIWAVGLSIFNSTPLIGVGFANFPVAFTPQRVSDAAIALSVGTERAPHDIFLGALAELGVVGCAVLALFLLSLTLGHGWGRQAPVVRATLVSLATAGIFLDILNRKQVWLVIGLAAGLAYLAREASRLPASGLGAPGKPVAAVRDGADRRPRTVSASLGSTGSYR